MRQHEDILSVWTQDSKDDDAIAKIRDAIKGNLDLPPFVTIDYKRISASRGAAAPSRHRRDSCPPDEVVGGFFFDFEAIRTDLTEMLRAGTCTCGCPRFMCSRACLASWH